MSANMIDDPCYLCTPDQTCEFCPPAGTLPGLGPDPIHDADEVRMRELELRVAALEGKLAAMSATIATAIARGGSL